jgi:hypothetical protein
MSLGWHGRNFGAHPTEVREIFALSYKHILKIAAVQIELLKRFRLAEAVG